MATSVCVSSATAHRSRRSGRTVIAGLLFACAAAATPAQAQPSLFHTRIVVSSRGVDVHGEVFRKKVPMSELLLAGARIVDLDQEPGLRPLLKIYGAGLPHYHAGWFRLKDREKALVALSRSRVAVYLPTTAGYAVLVSPEDPSAFLSAIQQPAADEQEFTVRNSR